MRQTTFAVAVVCSIGVLLTLPGHAEKSAREADPMQPANEVLQCVEPPQAHTVEAPLADVLLWIGEFNTESLSSCTQEQAALCPTGCGCLVINGNPCCIGLATHCALTC